MSNKNKGFCPLIDYGVPTGEVWVVRKAAIIPFHVEEVGTGPEGLAKLRVLQKAKQDKDWVSEQTRLQNATIAFRQGQGDLLEDLRSGELTHALPPGEGSYSDLTYASTVNKKTLLERLKHAVKAVWDSSNLSD